MPSLAGRAFAKLNLGLAILERRSDGFHELRTVFQTISLADRIEVGWRSGRRTRIELVCSELALAGADNLAWRAADELLRETGREGSVSIRIDKHIPSGGGLGGGSSDAGATLCALARLLRPAPSPAVLQGVAARLGSDVPFFLLGGRALGVGRGEEVYPLPEGTRQWFVLVTPPVRVSTAAAYRDLAASRRALTPDRKGPILNMFCAGFRAPDRAQADGAAGALANDFEDTVFQRFPELRQIKRKLLRVGARQALMSGSGSTLFGVFEDRSSAEQAKEKLRSGGLEAHLARTVSRAEFGRTWKRAGQNF